MTRIQANGLIYRNGGLFMKLSFFKKGNGASMIGMVIIFGTFVFIMILIDHFNRFNAVIETQTKTDAIADAMAVAANDGSGVPNLYRISKVRHQMTQKYITADYKSGEHGIMTPIVTPGLTSPFTKIKSIKFNEEWALGKEIDPLNETDKYLESLGVKSNDKILYVTAEGETPFINADYHKTDSEDTSWDYIYTHATNVTRMLTSNDALMQQKFPLDAYIRARPTYMNGDENKDTYCENPTFPLPTSDYLRDVTQFEVELSNRYKASQNISGDPPYTREAIFMWDVTCALGCEIPCYYNKFTGEPWQAVSEGNEQNYDGVILSNGATSADMSKVYDQPEGYYTFVKNYFFHIHSAVFPTDEEYIGCDKYNNWRLTARDGSDADTCRRIQIQANLGYPTIMVFTNGQNWVVLPEASTVDDDVDYEVSDGSRGVYISAASNATEEEAAATNVLKKNVNAGYRVPNGNYLAITYKPLQ